jgi:hypothetical protein
VFLVLRMDDGVFGVFVTNAESGAGSTIGSWSFGLGCFLPDFLSTLLRVFFVRSRRLKTDLFQSVPDLC